MRNISPEICRQIGQARRDHGLSQTALAAEIGCKQPAISMFEAGDGTKLSDEMVKKLAEKFGISLEQPPRGKMRTEEEGAERKSWGTPDSPLGFCPNCQCPSNVPYVVEGRLFFRPSARIAAPVQGSCRCAACGEVLELSCPACGAPLNEGACCVACGMPYVTSTVPQGTPLAVWARSRREEISALRNLA